MKFYPICDACVQGTGASCNEPTCAYCRSPAPPPMPWPEYGQDVNAGYLRGLEDAAKVVPTNWCDPHTLTPGV